MAPRLVVGAVIVDSLDSPAMVLAARRSRPAHLAGSWEFPGGKVEPGEDPDRALVREVDEELHLTLRLGPEVAHPEGAWPISERHELRLFLAEIASGAPRPDETHDEVRWLVAADLRSVTWLPADEAALGAVSRWLRGGGAVG